MSDLNPADIDLVRSVFEHRLRQDDLDRILAALSSSDRDELLAKIGDLLKHVSALVDLSNKVNDSLSLDIMLPRLIEVMSDALNADRSTLFLYDAETSDRESLTLLERSTTPCRSTSCCRASSR